ncbi:hypothetical protein BDN70DRAFT_984693 [Pholiota conissans]|uniref:Uncharacterized protein n=1 Tax=Pholiota conissans TaxID=109636 RepID=A0A9P5ZCN7_9AGAR|nr:hypothetical protein BDN70DRAFT_984693 [Pholiota conissans]
MSSTSFYLGGPLEIESRSQSQVPIFGTSNDIEHSENTNHPPMFGLKYSQLLSRSFDCQFLPSESDLQMHFPLSFYIENIVFATGLPFSVTVASLVLLQRMYTRLPLRAYKRRAEYSVHRLFTGAYILAAKQYVYLEQTVKRTHLQPLSDLPVRSWEKLSNEFWARISSYDVGEVKKLQREILLVLGRCVVVFPIMDRSVEADVKRMNSFPMFRNLPRRKDASLRNLSRMSWDEQYLYFVELGRRVGENKSMDPRPMVGWWKRQAQSDPGIIVAERSLSH